MNEKEKKAIEDLKHTLKISDELFEDVGDRLIDTRSSLQIETVLNLIEKQQTIINTMQAEFERLEDLEDNTDMLKMELKKKDKIIDLMAEEIASYNHYEALGKLEDKEEVVEHFNQKIEKGE